jgi:hypothetical protein
MSKKVIMNVGTLDLRNASEEALAEVTRLMNVGVVLCAGDPGSVLTGRDMLNVGHVLQVPPNVPVIPGTLTLDEAYLRDLDDSAELAVLGRLRLPAVLPNDLLGAKLGKVYALGRVVCHQENLQVLRSRLADPSKRIKTIPAGFALIDDQLVLGSAALESLPAPKLYCTRRVEVAADVDAALLDGRLEALVGENLVLCPAGLKGILSKKCDWTKTQIVYYEGKLWIVDDVRDLSPYHLETMEGKATLVVLGELRVDADVTPQALSDRLGKVHNLGLISCTPAQMEAIRPLLGLRDGELADSTPVEEPEEPEDEEPEEHGYYRGGLREDEEMIGNAAYLVL